MFRFIADMFLRLTGDEYVQRAFENREKATWPGCEAGHMECVNLTCLCKERTPSPEFVRARADYLRLVGQRNSGEAER